MRVADAARTYPEGWRVTFSPPRKTRDQEAKYHAMIGEIAKQWMFCDREWDSEDMKRLLIDQFRRDTVNDDDLKEEWDHVAVIDMAPSIDRKGVVALGVQSKRFTKKLASSFVEWLYAFGAENGVEFTT
jgi:hypothetical protein